MTLKISVYDVVSYDHHRKNTALPSGPGKGLILITPGNNRGWTSTTRL